MKALKEAVKEGNIERIEALAPYLMERHPTIKQNSDDMLNFQKTVKEGLDDVEEQIRRDKAKGNRGERQDKLGALARRIRDNLGEHVNQYAPPNKKGETKKIQRMSVGDYFTGFDNIDREKRDTFINDQDEINDILGNISAYLNGQGLKIAKGKKQGNKVPKRARATNKSKLYKIANGLFKDI